ncbi:fasciclin domain-containing protein [Prevotella sp. E13-27]|uniref:fasciclin domain-containing protein n=1 Tax=Prevotella sp. E13-27 TaxID=2938122 RepID=UPI00200A7700|nr:fasciclin domain-containing protein [Prevotella sp. E13-27]MCK8622105.1 fasciclin domain-containing protein [Prevotella sp. E13-27]
MKTKRQSLLWVMAAGFLLAGSGALTSCTDKYDLDERTPGGWGSTIYTWLEQQGNYTNTVRLIDELGQKEVLSKTGSRTLFAADDAAFERFFNSDNGWGVKSYDQLSLAQKKLLLYGSMIDNSIQASALSTIEGTPLREGQCMRRFTFLDEYDSVPVLKPSQMPVNKYWQRHIDAGKDMVCFQDGSRIPMLLFLQGFMTNNKITNEDYNFLFNHQTNREDGDASVNGKKVINQNVRCGNGFIHVVNDVVSPLPNMAKIISDKEQCKIYTRLLNRFCAPYPDDKDLTKTVEYNRIYGTNVDTVYTMRYLNDKRDNETFETPDGAVVISREGAAQKIKNPTLTFDPGWNAYYSASHKNTSEGNVAEQRDMAVMLVPTDKAMMDYWNDENKGKPLRDNFPGGWDTVDDKVIIELLRLNMLPSFISSVPSKFAGVLNDANDPMGLKESSVDSVWMACNGAVYQLNTVYPPTAYVCVSFPTIVDKSLRIIDWAIEQCKYSFYLKALGTTYSFFVPNNHGLIEYVDPCSYGKSQLQLLSFRWDDASGVSAVIYDYDPSTGYRDSVGVTTDYNRLVGCLRDILDTHIVMGNVWEGNKTYYRTKNGTGIRVNKNPDDEHMTVEGSYQMYDSKQPVPVAKVWDQRKEVTGGNGKTYILDAQPIMGTRKTVCNQLENVPDFQYFFDLLDKSGLASEFYNPGTGKKEDNKACGGKNITLFNTYHYTIYVPSNDAIQNLFDTGQLPTWDDYQNKIDAGNTLGATEDSLKIVNFLKYHIQDNALYIGANNESGDFETSCINEDTGRFMMLHAELKDDEIVVTDGTGAVHKVTKQTYFDGDGIEQPLYNIQAREYVYDGQNAATATSLYTTSSAVIHLIDSPLRNGAKNGSW